MSNIETENIYDESDFQDASVINISSAEKVRVVKEADEYADMSFFDKLNQKIIDASPVGIKDKLIF